ncbi:MAG TPA: hypothetical protein VKV26_02040 [Dehalococcoidia bacterium]|nr:hypothetical protein [Dehalococcoidia bacterium]
MSTNWVLVIPTNPTWVPGAETAAAALDLYRTLFPLHSGDGGICAKVYDEITFVHQGANWEELRCPACAAILDAGWWQERMDEANAMKFTQLAVSTPCCGAQTSLNDLAYDWPAGFARFVLSAENPERGWLNAEELSAIAAALDHPVRQILRHM